MDSFLNEKVNIIVATKSGGGTSCGNPIIAVANNTLTIRGTLVKLDKNFAILENSEITELPQHASTVNSQIIPAKYSYSKTAINLDSIITISIV